MNDGISKFKKIFKNTDGLKALRSPGRVNLIGEHTDYNDGFVLPFAISREIRAYFRKRDDERVRIYSYDFDEFKEFSLKDNLKKEGSWIDYVKGVAFELREEAQIDKGFDAIFFSTLPLSSGLSSSAAFELANAFIFSDVNGLSLSRKKLALISRRAENNFVGVNCGIMDQFAISLSNEGEALFIDTRTLFYESVPLNINNCVFIVSNTNKKRELADSEYNKRREECNSALKTIKEKKRDVEALRDLKVEDLDWVRNVLKNDTLFRRVKHVVEENERVIRSLELLKNGKLKEFGMLMKESHSSLKELYEVSCFELDTLVDEALKVEGVFGSRMTGAGFGGCTITLLEKGYKDEFIERVSYKYREKTGLNADFYIVQPVRGTEILSSLEEK